MGLQGDLEKELLGLGRGVANVVANMNRQAAVEFLIKETFRAVERNAAKCSRRQSRKKSLVSRIIIARRVQYSIVTRFTPGLKAFPHQSTTLFS